jgi:hypothetical protein
MILKATKENTAVAAAIARPGKHLLSIREKIPHIGKEE